jgi:hypothetical protein
MPTIAAGRLLSLAQYIVAVLLRDRRFGRVDSAVVCIAGTAPLDEGIPKAGAERGRAKLRPPLSPY